MSEQAQNLQFYLSELGLLFQRWTQRDLSWTKILVIEQDSMRLAAGKNTIPCSAFIDAEHYSERFNQLLERGYSWLNMNAAGILGDALIVVVELPRDTSNVSGKTSVNFSGPTAVAGKSQWDLSGSLIVESNAS